MLFVVCTPCYFHVGADVEDPRVFVGGLVTTAETCSNGSIEDAVTLDA